MVKCVICKEAIWNPVSPKQVLSEALNLLYELKRYDLAEELKKYFEEYFKNLRKTFRIRFKYMDDTKDVPVCWGCLWDIIYDFLKERDEKIAELWKKHFCPYGL